MKSIDKIPTSKLSRISKLVGTGAKVGGNYVKHYSKKAFNPDLSKDELNKDNAAVIYDSLSELKGSSLKVAQMLSMEKNVLPKEYVEKFSLAQFSVPAMSAPLVVKTLQRYLDDSIDKTYDTFDSTASFAATIGQVHRATKNGEQLAVKIQYPGVAESIDSDLAIVKPVAKKMFNLKGKEFEKYFQEVQDKLLDETDYNLELQNSIKISKACNHIDGINFPQYYPSLSGSKHLAMEWVTGKHLSEFAKINSNPELGNKIGQSLWDFYMFQLFELKSVHADPHPGNFLVNEKQNLVALDFGCVKDFPTEFHEPYFNLIQPGVISNRAALVENMRLLEIIRPDDTEEEIEFFVDLFKPLLSLLTKPFQAGESNDGNFDFNNDEYFKELAEMGQKLSSNKDLKKINPNRGSRHFLYMNRTFFGLYNLLYDLKANIDINKFKEYLTPSPIAV